MSLTEEAYEERKWGPFPALRQTLATKQIPDRYFGLTSASDNMFARLDRLLQISILVEEYGDEIAGAAQDVGVRETIEDVERLEEMLRHAARMFEDMAGRARSVAANVYEEFQRRDYEESTRRGAS